MEEKIMPDGHVELVPKNKFSTLSTTDRPGGGRMQSYCHFAGDFTYNDIYSAISLAPDCKKYIDVPEDGGDD